MAALSLHSQPFHEAALSPVAALPSQRLTRHALAILQLLTSEGDGVTAGDDGPAHDRRAQEKKLLADQIMKLVLGILHLLNEGLEQTAPFSEDDWLCVEREQRQLYSDLMTDNDHTLGTLGSFTVKSEEVSATEIEEEEEAQATEMSSDSVPAPVRGLNPYSDSRPDPPKAELSEPPSLASYQNPFLDTLKSGGGLPMFPDASNYSDPTAGSYAGHSSLNAFPRGFPETSKEACMATVVEAASMMGNGMADPYLANSSDDFPVENMPIQIKREGSASHHQLSVCEYDTAGSDNPNRRLSPQPSCRKTGQAPGTSNVCRNPIPNTSRIPASDASRIQACNTGRNPASDTSRIQASNTGRNPASNMSSIQASDTGRNPEQVAPKLSTMPNSYLKQTQRKRFQCEQCEKTFTYRAHLVMHRRVHTRERPYVCECGKTFSQSSHLFRHQRSLRGEGPHHNSYILVRQGSGVRERL